MNMDIISRLQTIFSVSKAELTVIFVLLIGLIIGAANKYFLDDEPTQSNHSDLYTVLDSLAEIRRTSYIGSNLKGGSFDSLSKADTQYVEESYYPKAVTAAKVQGNEKININTASKVLLRKLPGVGEKTALKIIEYRESQLFETPEDIMNIKGIGPKKFEKMKKNIRVK